MLFSVSKKELKNIFLLYVVVVYCFLTQYIVFVLLSVKAWFYKKMREGKNKKWQIMSCMFRE